MQNLPERGVRIVGAAAECIAILVRYAHALRGTISVPLFVFMVSVVLVLLLRADEHLSALWPGCFALC